MGKLIAIACAGCGTALVATGGIYVYKNKDSNGIKNLQNLFLGLADDLADLDAPKDECVSAMFPGFEPETFLLPLVSSALGKESPTEGVKLSDHLGTPNANDAKGCLNVFWSKGETGEESNKKWKGKISWVWALKNGDKGFVSMVRGSAGSFSSGKFKLIGSVYLLEKKKQEGKGDKWEIVHSKSNTLGKEIGENEFDKLPKEKANGPVKIEGGQSNWGFIKGKEELANICGFTDRCSVKDNLKKEHKKWSWTYGVGSGNHKASDWASDWNWWNHLFGDDTFSPSNGFDSFSGTWTADTTSKTSETSA